MILFASSKEENGNNSSLKQKCHKNILSLLISMLISQEKVYSRTYTHTHTHTHTHTYVYIYYFCPSI